MKKTALFLMFIMVTAVFAGCSMPVMKVEKYEVTEYGQVFEIRSFKETHENKAEKTVFPENTEQLNILQLSGVYYNTEPKTAVYLQVGYDGEAYAKEKERLSSIVDECGDDFALPENDEIYPLLLGEPEYEYAICNNENNTVTYVYLLYMKKADFDINPTILPNKYSPNGQVTAAKPIIYLYPEKETVCSVKLDYNGRFTTTYPEYGVNGWEGFTAYPDGTLIFPDGRQYYALYWEGVGDAEFDFSEGFCVKGSDTAEFLYGALRKAGLNDREAEELIIYWLPKMQDNEYNLISFQTTAYTDNAKLTVTPAPDTVIRVFMAYKPLENAAKITPQTIETPQRTGFTVVEWGGCEVR